MYYKKFSLIELMVVVSIIAILSSILLPALKRARDTGHKIACINNLKQLGLAFPMYCDDFDGWYPTLWIQGTVSDGGVPYYAGYYQARMKYSLFTEYMNYRHKYHLGYMHKDGSRSPFMCNSYNPAKEDLEACLATCYGMNYRLWSGFIGGSARFNMIKYPSMTALYGESGRLCPASGVTIDYWKRAAPEFRHNGFSNFLYCDGHVSSRKAGRATGAPGWPLTTDEDRDWRGNHVLWNAINPIHFD